MEFTERIVAEVRSCKIGATLMLLLKCDSRGSHKAKTLTKACLKVRPSLKHNNVHYVTAGPI